MPNGGCASAAPAPASRARPIRLQRSPSARDPPSRAVSSSMRIRRGQWSSSGTVWVGDAQAGKQAALLGLHRLGLGVGLVVAAQQMQHAVDDQMASDDRTGSCPAPPPRPRRRRRPGRCRPDAARARHVRPPERTGHWSAGPCRGTAHSDREHGVVVGQQDDNVAHGCRPGPRRRALDHAVDVGHGVASRPSSSTSTSIMRVGAVVLEIRRPGRPPAASAS